MKSVSHILPVRRNADELGARRQALSEDAAAIVRAIAQENLFPSYARPPVVADNHHRVPQPETLWQFMFQGLRGVES